MAMTHLQPAVLLLLTSLFFLPALHGAIDFEYCAGKYGNDYVNVSRIEISNPDDSSGQITISVYGSAGKDIIPMGFVVNVYTKSGEFPGLIRMYYIYEVCNIHGPIEAGTNFVLTLPKIYWSRFDQNITYSVTLGEEDREEPIEAIMCVDFKVITSTPTLVVSA